MDEVRIEAGGCANLGEEDVRLDKQQAERLEQHGVIAKVMPKTKGNSEIIIYSKEPRTLSGNIPILANLGFEIDSESAFKVTGEGCTFHCQKYFLNCKEFTQLKATAKNIERTIEKTIIGSLKNSPLNALAFEINTPVEGIEILRAVSSYEQQLVSDFSQALINETLIKYNVITKLFLSYMEAKFDPAYKNRGAGLKQIHEDILSAIKEVKNINEDRVLTCFYAILKAIVRTNYFVIKDKLFEKEAIALKIDVRELSDFTEGVQPRFEIFVYHSSFEGVHLRRNNVSRGGIRWSDRLDDYRNEIRLLMQAQRQKNSIIVPSGAKGGFVIHNPVKNKEEFRGVYKLYINALLDMVDNKVGDEVAVNDALVRYDENDTYFVVAADKGTSDMSDTANAIAKERGFWLDDAFASGGSQGYNHKEMGITAKGAMRSVERFFIEINKDIQQESVSVVGIGSPAGDVFGNGMLLSEKFSLVAAISSREIFVDPVPDVVRAYKERKRLFDKGQGWSTYDKKLISQGGGIFRKDDKEISITPEMKNLFGIKKDVMNGEELTRVILCAKVDMLFNGGVGTYVRASNQSNTEIGDKPNESVRVMAKDIKAYAVCEGGNLGFTQKARLEFAKRGGKISADSIDNSAGVQTSDYEVNIKIILNKLLKIGAISAEKRYEILMGLTDEVEEIVLKTNYAQALALSVDSIRSGMYPNRIKETLLVLEEKVDSFRREHFDIPGIDEFDRAIGKGERVLRPVLSVMLSFSKIFLKSFLLRQHAFLDSEFALHYLYKYFPKSFVAVYRQEIESHPLKHEIIATYISNKVVNAHGCTFAYDFHALTEEEFLLKIKSFLVVNELISGNAIRDDIAKEDFTLSAKKQYDLLLILDDTLEFLISWMLDHGEYEITVFDHISEYKKLLQEFMLSLEDVASKQICANSRLNIFYGNIEFVKMILDIVRVKEMESDGFMDVAALFYEAMQNLNIIYLIQGIKSLKSVNAWEEKMNRELEKELFATLSKIMVEILEFRRSSESVKNAFSAYLENKKCQYGRYAEDVKKLRNSSDPLTATSLFVVINSLKKLA